jgi:hypothetical protein
MSSPDCGQERVARRGKHVIVGCATLQEVLDVYEGFQPIRLYLDKGDQALYGWIFRMFHVW